MLTILATSVLLAAFCAFCGLLSAAHEGSRGRSAWAGFGEGILAGVLILAVVGAVSGAVMALAWACEHLFGGSA